MKRRGAISPHSRFRDDPFRFQAVRFLSVRGELASRLTPVI